MDFLTIAGYLIAALAIAGGLYLLMRKNAASESPGVAPASDASHPHAPHHAPKAGLQHNAPESTSTPLDSSPTLTVVPRHERQLHTDSADFGISPPDENRLQLDGIEPTDQSQPDWHLSDIALPDEPGRTASLQKTTTDQHAAQHAPSQRESLAQAAGNRPEPPAADAFDQVLAQLEAATSPGEQPHNQQLSNESPDAPLQGQDLTAPAASGIQPGNSVKTTEVEQWVGESALLDAHIEDQARRDDESALAQAEQVVALYVMPSAGRPLTGERVMQLLRQFGLRYGEMALFHRFENSDGTGPLMFSVLRYTAEGPSGFDLETLPGEQIEGLAFFLALPGKYAIAGFDTMISISTLMAREINGQVLDDQMNPLTQQLREHYRHFVMDYRSPY